MFPHSNMSPVLKSEQVFLQDDGAETRKSASKKEGSPVISIALHAVEVPRHCHTLDICMGVHWPVWSRNTRRAKVSQGPFRLDTVGVRGSNPLSRTIFFGLDSRIRFSGEIRHFEKLAKRVGAVEPAFEIFCQFGVFLYQVVVTGRSPIQHPIRRSH
jgi:hypothetical protein